MGRCRACIDEPAVTVRIDPELPVPALGGPVPRLPTPGGDALLAGRAGACPYVVEGGASTLTGSERGGVEAIHVGGRLVARDLQADVGMAVNVLVTPASMQRERVGTRGSILETSMAAPTLPLVALQWRAPDGAPPLGGLDLSVVLLPGARNVRYRIAEEGVRAVAEEDDEAWVVDLRVWPAPSSWSAVETDGGGILVRAAVEDEGPVTLLLTGGLGDLAEQALSAGRHLGAHARLAAEEASFESVRTLASATGVADLDRGVLWATRRLQAATRRGRGKPPPPEVDAGALFWSGVGAAAIGDEAEDALAVLATLEGDTDAGLGALLPVEALTTLLAARATLTTGRARRLLDRVRSLDPEGLDSARRAGGDAWAAWRLALRRSADALRHTAPADLIRELRAEASRSPEGEHRRLPMVGQGSPSSATALLERLLFPSPRAARPPGPAPHADDTLDAWVRFVRGEPGHAYAAWRSGLAEGLDPSEETRGRGMWDADAHGPPRAAPRAGVLLATLAHGLLGLDPDAPSGRVGMAPRLPRQLRSFGVRGIRVGDVRLSLTYRRTGGRHRLELDLREGREPPLAVLGPMFPCGGLRRILVDGEPVDLETEETSDGVVVFVQLPVTGPRVLEVEEL